MSEIDEKLFGQGSVFYVSHLRDKYRTWLSDQGVEAAFSYRSGKLINRMQKYYKERVMVVPQKGTSSLLCSSELSVVCVLAEVRKFKEQLREEDYAEESYVEKIVGPPNAIDSESFNVAKSIQ